MVKVISLYMMSLKEPPFAITFQTANLTPTRETATVPAVLNLLKQIGKKTHFIVFCSCFIIL